jgi:hypothetical protein
VDGHGRRPKAPAPAYYQVIKGQTFQEFTAEDLVYTRFRPQMDSPFGMAPMESIMMVANTDMRFQWHLLQMFTEGSIPGGFMEVPPDVSSPDQVAEWQDYWDATFTGDQSIVHKLIAVPNGAKFTGTAPAAFDPNFPEYLALQVCAAFGVVPQDLGLTKDVNKATGETQTDTQFRVNTLPWVRFVESHLNRYLQHDLGLPVQIKLNTGRDKEDRLQEAQAWKIYTEAGFASVDEAREELLGLPSSSGRPVPRFVLSARQGPIPLESILAISGTIDPETKAPSDDVPLNEAPFTGTPGLMPDKLPGGAEFKRAPIDPDEPAFPQLEHSHPDTGTVAPAAAPVTKELTAGVTAATGIEGIDQLDRDDDEPDDDPAPDDDAAKKELAKFRAFTKARARNGKWRDFEFTTITKAVGDHLNAQAREQFAKDNPDDLGTGSDARPKAGTPSWRDTPPVTAPQHLVDLQLTDYYAPKINDALTALWETADYETATSAAQGAGDVALGVYRDVARQALAGTIRPGQLDAVVQQAWADAYKVGMMAAQVQMGQIPVGWDTWKPGMTDANKITADGWKTALDQAQIRLKGITDTTLDKVAARIADGVNAGDPSDSIGRAISDVLGDPARAELISHTETARMLTDAAMGQYNALGVTQWDLVTSAGVCDQCRDIEFANPHPVSDTSDTPPVHPRCRCAASPHIEGNTL